MGPGRAAVPVPVGRSFLRPFEELALSPKRAFLWVPERGVLWDPPPSAWPLLGGGVTPPPAASQALLCGVVPPPPT